MPGPSTVLVVDDDEPLQRQLRYLLEDAGHRVMCAFSGAEAARYLDEVSFEVALVDIGLPDVDGIQLLELARSKQPDISVLVITGHASLDTSIKAMFLGAVGYLLKPVEPAVLETQVREAALRCGQKKRNRENYRTILRTVNGWQAISRCLSERLVTLTPEGRIQSMDSRAAAIFGLTVDEARERPLWEIAARGEGSAAGEIERMVSNLPPGLLLGPVLAAGTPASGPELLAVPGNGPMPGPEGLAVPELARDKSLVNQLLLTSRMAAIGNLAAGVAHEINNPLQVIQGWTEKLRWETSDPASREQGLARIEQSVLRCVSIIKNLGRAAAPKEVCTRPIPITTVINGTLDLLQHELPKRNIQVRVEAPAESPLVLADEDELHQVFLNLLLNSRDAMPEGGTIGIKIEAAGRLVGIEVTDTGSGIPSEILGRVFDPFFTTKGPDRGMGLGLYVTHSLVQKHRGQIHVESSAGKGTKVKLVLPASSETMGETASVQRPKTVSPQLNILVVDDEPPILEILDSWLSGQGHEVRSCQSGEEALAVTRNGNRRFDLLIIDLKMPGMGGWEAFLQIRTHQPGIRVIILTGSLEPKVPPAVASVFQSLALLKKPVRLVQLDEAIADLMEKRSAALAGSSGPAPGQKIEPSSD